MGQFPTVTSGADCESVICGTYIIKAITPKWHSSSYKSHMTPRSVGWLVTLEGEVFRKLPRPGPRPLTPWLIRCAFKSHRVHLFWQ